MGNETNEVSVALESLFIVIIFHNSTLTVHFDMFDFQFITHPTQLPILIQIQCSLNA